MELGRHIADELKLNDRGDWLRHWLAHHVAELVRDAETAKDRISRGQATKRATDTILKIWEHREALPGAVNPLARYREALEALNQLRPAAPPQFLRDALSDRSVVGSIYSRFPRLIEALVLLPVVRAGRKDNATAQVVRKFLGKDERTLLDMLEIRVRMFGEKEDQAATSAKDEYQRFEEAAYKLIDNMIADLKSIRDEKETSRAGPRRSPRP